MKFIFNDGGRHEAGFDVRANDCATRAIAICLDIPYNDAYGIVEKYCRTEKPSKTRKGKSSVSSGVHKVTMDKLMDALGFTWVPTMTIGSGCTVHMKSDELPSGWIIVRLSRHYAAVIDGVLHDNHDCTRDGSRCVYGYWKLTN